MKNTIIKYLGVVILVLLTANCQDLERPGFSDFAYDGPVISLSTPSPSGSTVIRSLEPTAPVTIKFEVVDDLGIANIKVELDGQEIANMTEFADNRHVVVEDLTEEVATGSHTLTITATDTNDVIVTVTAAFEKIESLPYTPLLQGEILYMAFNADYSDAVSGSAATEVGTPGFAGQAKAGSDAYAGATDSYLTFPGEGLMNDEFSASFWYKVNGDPDRAGILTMRPPMTDGKHDLTKGFSLFREGGAKQTIKLNVGMGSEHQWVDGGEASQVDTSVNNWVHVAFSIATDKATVYINGNLAKEVDLESPIDWTGVEILSIMSGAPNFTQWNHNSDSSYMDELRLFNRALTQDDIIKLVADGSKVFDMPFNGAYTETISGTDATAVGDPGFSEGMDGEAYAGAADAYLTMPTDGLKSPEISATMWYKVNNDPDRAGILVIGPPDEANPDAMNNRKNGFRLFRENGADGNQRIKLNVGRGDGDTWVDGNTAADIDPTSDEWVFLAFTIASDKASVYINGELVKASDLASGIDWTGCDILSIGSGAPRFTGWGHLSDQSLIDELKMYDKALSQEEIQQLMGN